MAIMRIRQLKRKYHTSLRARLLVSFILLASIPAMITGLLGFRISSEIVSDMAMDSSVEMVERIAQELNSLFSDSIYFMYHIQELQSLRQGLRQDFSTIDKRYMTDFNVSSELQFISDYKKEIFGIFVLGENLSKFKSNYYNFREDDLRSSLWYKMILSSSTLVTLGPYQDSLVVKTAPRWGMEFFGFGIPFIDRSTGKRQGVILAEFERRLISDIIDSTLGKTGSILLLDSGNSPLLSSGDYREDVNFSFLGKTEPEDFKDLIVNERFLGDGKQAGPDIHRREQHILISQTIDIPNWKVVGMIPYREIRIDKNNTLWYILLVTAATCVLAYFAALKISTAIVRPVSQLTSLMSLVEGGNLQVRMEPPGEDEIGRLAEGFNLMTEQLELSRDEIYDKQNRIRKTELQLLQAQINPHFLYNTLDAIKFLAKKGETAQVAKMVVALARFFRSSLSKGRAEVPLREELERIDHYLTILKMRYKDKFSYSFEIPPELNDCLVLKLCLQPIVENAVYHGIKEQPDNGIILIRAVSRGDRLVIEVEDSGKGMTEQDRRDLSGRIRKRPGQGGRSFGLANVQERIEIFFGKEYGLEFRERDGGGTIVSLILPRQDGAEY